MNNEPTQEYKRGYNAGFEAGELVGKHFHPVKELTDEEVYELADQCRKLANPNVEFARAILRKAQEK